LKREKRKKRKLNNGRSSKAVDDSESGTDSEDDTEETEIPTTPEKVVKSRPVPLSPERIAEEHVGDSLEQSGSDQISSQRYSNQAF
jgi:hypothetical protein